MRTAIPTPQSQSLQTEHPQYRYYPELRVRLFRLLRVRVCRLNTLNIDTTRNYAYGYSDSSESESAD